MHISNKTFNTESIGGVDFDFMKLAEVPKHIAAWRQAGRRGYVTLVNPHSVMMCGRDERMREAIRGADLTLPDGVGIVLGAKLLGLGRQHRVTGPALMLGMCDGGREMRLRHFFYGGREGVAEQLAARLSSDYPGLQVAGTFCPPFREITPEEDARIVAQINAAKPDIVWVGTGAPKQEKWMADHVYRIRATALIGVGAAFDFHSGNAQWAPQWVRRIGCEWAYRLVREPRRMWRRNLDSPLFLGRVAGQAVARAAARLLAQAARTRDWLAVDQGHDGDGPSGGAAPTVTGIESPRRPIPEISQSAARVFNAM